MPPLPVITAHELLRALRKAGFIQTRQKGSHVRLKHPDGRVITVPVHTGKEVGKGLLRKILRDADWSVEDLLALLK